MTKKSFAVFAREGSGCVRNGFEEFVEGSRVVLSDNGFQLGESVGTFSDVVNLARLMSYDFWVFFRIGVVKCAHFCRMLAIKKARFQSGLFRF